MVEMFGKEKKGLSSSLVCIFRKADYMVERLKSI